MIGGANDAVAGKFAEPRQDPYSLTAPVRLET